MTRASLDKDPREVAAMFDDVAGKLRPHQRRALPRPGPAVAHGGRPRRSTPRPGSACSTSPRAPAPRASRSPTPGVDVVPCRLLPRHAARSATAAGPTWRSPPPTRCACRSPTTSFDAVTISFGLRNVADTGAALREFLRVTRPGGRLVVCEFSQPVNGAFRTVYTEYLMRVAAAVARRVSSNPEPTSTSPSRSGPGPTSAALAARRPRRRLGRGRLAQPHRRDRGAAPGRQARRPVLVGDAGAVRSAVSTTSGATRA